MGRIREIKKQVRHKEWAAMVQECQSSGKKVEEWCNENGINISTYYECDQNRAYRRKRKSEYRSGKCFHCCFGCEQFGYRECSEEMQL